MSQPTPCPLPASATPAAVVGAGLASLALGCWVVFGLRLLGDVQHTAVATWAAVWLIAGLGGGMTLWDLAFVRSYRANLSAPERMPAWTERAGRVLRKWLGLHAVLAVIGAVYWVLQEYRSDLYRPFFHVAERLLPWFSVAALPYIAWVDARMHQPRDLYWRLGDALLGGRRPQLSRADALPFALGWLVKGFFLPLMFGYAVRQIQDLDRAVLLRGDIGFRQVFEWTFTLLYFVDVVWGAVGYLWSLRLTDSHVRSAEPTVAGWAVALMCYEPFAKGLWPAYFAYGSGKAWGHWLGDWPWMYMAWGSAILLLVGVYTASTMAFGLRFSNLTHRGVITGGPYRWLRHPAYVSKNLSWWLISMPFMVSSSVADSVRLCAMLLLVNAVYWLRARTEEKHLSVDPAYRAYLDAMASRRAAWRGRVARLLRTGRRPRLTGPAAGLAAAAPSDGLSARLA